VELDEEEADAEDFRKLEVSAVGQALKQIQDDGGDLSATQLAVLQEWEGLN